MSLRLFFPNTTRPKKAAKHLVQLLGLPLAKAQRGIARACGYRDWHGLEEGSAASAPSPLDQNLPQEDFIRRHAQISLALAHALDIPDGDTQHALIGGRLTGDRSIQLADQIAIRLACFRETVLPQAVSRSSGAVGKLKTLGRNGEVVILRQVGRPTEVISHRGVTTVADFEYVSPREQPSLFLPMRLYLPYGIWTEPDGAQVVFSRDYKPLWRVRKSGMVERLEPWLWIRYDKQTFLWDDTGTPWGRPSSKARLERQLAAMGIEGLPILVDALPLLVIADAVSSLSMSDATDLLRRTRSEVLPVISV